jgi:hypothetical protein
MLNKSTTWPEAVKAEIRNGLNINCMSPEQSEEEDGGESQQSDSDSDEEGQESNKRKVIKVRALSWRSERFTNILSSLDRKYLRKISERARSMMQERRAGETLVRHAPDDVPAWMVKR